MSRAKTNLDDLTRLEAQLANMAAGLVHTQMPQQEGTRALRPAMIQKGALKDPKNTWKEYLCIERMHPEAVLPTKASVDDAGYDLYAFEPVVIAPWTSAVVRTMVRVALPPDTYGRIASRSGLAAKYNIEVGAGVIDRGYQGEIMVLLRNFSDQTYSVMRGDRIAQLIITPCKSFAIKDCSKITDLFGVSERGAKGFGSSGK